MAGTEPLLIACKQGPTVSVNLQVPAGTKASGLQHAVALSPGGLASCADLLHSSQHSELLGIDSLIIKCGVCGSQIMVLILARDTTHWALRVLSSSSVPAHLPIIHKLA